MINCTWNFDDHKKELVRMVVGSRFSSLSHSKPLLWLSANTATTITTSVATTTTTTDTIAAAAAATAAYKSLACKTAVHISCDIKSTL